MFKNKKWISVVIDSIFDPVGFFVICAFAVIGVILLVSLSPKKTYDKGGIRVIHQSSKIVPASNQ